MIELTEEQRAELDAYPKIEISQLEFDELLEYSTSIPTQSGSVGVKKWKRRTPLNASTDEAIWFHGEIKEGQVIFHHIVIAE